VNDNDYLTWTRVHKQTDQGDHLFSPFPAPYSLSIFDRFVSVTATGHALSFGQLARLAAGEPFKVHSARSID
jgi:hypothetical protein